MEGLIATGDCVEVMAGLPDGSVDLIIADPPYFKIVKQEWDHQWDSIDGYVAWLHLVFAQFHRVLRDQGACYVYAAITNYPHVQLALNEHLDYASTITWKKQRGRGNGWGFNREEICVNTKGKHKFTPVESQALMLPHLRKGSIDHSGGRKRVRKRDYKLASSIWDDVSQVCSHRKQFTPTEKPVELARRMLLGSTQPDDLVLVPFAGSGSEIEACVELDRRFIGIERDAATVLIAQQRIGSLR
jgi:DNA modification methylase